MRITRLHYLTIIVLLISINIFLLIKLKSFQKVNISCETSNKINEIYFKKSMVENENENLKMPNSLKLLDMQGDSIFAKDIFRKKILVFRYSILNCSDCVNAEFDELINEFLIDKSKIKNTCLLAYYEKARDLLVDYRKFQDKHINIQMYILPINQFNIPIEIQNLPYFFTIDSSLLMSDFFIPMKEKPDWSRSYLKLVFKKYFN